MSIVRVIKNKKNPYLIMNKTVLEDRRLSLKAKGLCCYLLSKPDNWYVNTNEIVSNNSNGIKSIWSSIKELVKFGYMYKHQFRSDNGQFHNYNYLIFEKPESPHLIKTITSPNRPFRISDKRSSDKDTLLINNKEVINKTTATKSSNKSNSNAVAVDNFVKKNKKTEIILLLKELKIRNHKKLFDLFSLSDIFKYASWIKDKNCRMVNPTGFLITAIREKWIYSLDSDSDDNETLLFYYKCHTCGKVFAYSDPIHNYDFCNKCGGIY